MDVVDFRTMMRESMVPMHLIERNLFLGNLEAANNENLLRKNGVNCIVQCLATPSMVRQFPHILYHRVPVDDMPTQNIARHVPEAIRFIHHNLLEGKTVLVHCAAGVSRSSSIVIAYYMGKYGIDFDRAKQAVQSKRRCVCPNNGFETQLRRISPQELQAWLQ